MPRQSLLRLIKRVKRYEPLDKCGDVKPKTRGIYVLYDKKPKESYNVVYIGVAGLGKDGGGGVRAFEEAPGQ